MSDADDIKARLAQVPIRTAGHAKLDALVKAGKWREAQTLGSQLGYPVSRNVVINLADRRVRA